MQASQRREGAGVAVMSVRPWLWWWANWVMADGSHYIYATYCSLLNVTESTLRERQMRRLRGGVSGWKAVCCLLSHSSVVASSLDFWNLFFGGRGLRQVLVYPGLASNSPCG